MSRILRFTLERRGYRVLHDRRIPGHRRVDQMVIGPTGVWLVDNQAWHPDTEIAAYGGRLFIGKLTGAEMASELRAMAVTAASVLSGELGWDIVAAPLVAVHGGKVARAGLTADGLTVQRGFRVPGWIRRRHLAHYGPDQVEEVTRAAIRVLPVGGRTMAPD